MKWRIHLSSPRKLQSWKIKCDEQFSNWPVYYRSGKEEQNGISVNYVCGAWHASGPLPAIIFSEKKGKDDPYMIMFRYDLWAIENEWEIDEPFIFPQEE